MGKWWLDSGNFWISGDLLSRKEREGKEGEETHWKLARKDDKLEKYIFWWSEHAAKRECDP